MIQQEEENPQEKIKKPRRALLKKSIGATVAVAGVGAVAAMQAAGETAYADGAEGPTQFSGASPVVTVTVTGSTQASVTLAGDHVENLVNVPPGLGIQAMGKIAGVVGQSDISPGVQGFSISNTGVSGISNSEAGVSGSGLQLGVRGVNGNITPTVVAAGVFGHSGGDDGVYGLSDTGIGVHGTGSIGVQGTSSTGTGVLAQAAATAGTALRVQGPIKVGAFNSVTNSPVGTATIADKTSSVTVTNPVATPNSIVILTPLSDPGGNLWVTPAAGSFTINRSAHRPSVTIAYLIIN